MPFEYVDHQRWSFISNYTKNKNLFKKEKIREDLIFSRSESNLEKKKGKGR